MISQTKNRWVQAAVNIAFIAVFLFAISFLPPDNSLAEIRRTGVIKLCVPRHFPPLAQDDPQDPGFDVELVRMIAEEIGVRMTVNVMISMGQDFNPRNWRLTRGQCNIIAGGVADTVQTRNFLQTIPTDIENGWVAVSRTGEPPMRGTVWAVWPGSSGLDRISLSSWVREQGVTPRLIRSPDELAPLLDSAEIDGAIVERFVASAANLSGHSIFWLAPERFRHYPMALGLWKGDQTLYRAVEKSLRTIKGTEMFASMTIHYGLDRSIAVPP